MIGKRHGWLTPALLLLGCRLLCAPAQADDEATARAYLSSNGLVASGYVWLTPQEVQLRKRLDTLDALEKRLRQAAQNQKAMLQRNEAIRAQLALAEAAPGGNKSGSKTPPGTAPKTSPGDSKARPETKLNSKMTDVTGVGEQTPLQLSSIELVNARNALLLAVLEIRETSRDLETAYAPLRADQRVAASLLALGSKWRLGPAKDYQREQPRLAGAAQSVLTSRVPIYQEGGKNRISAIINEHCPATFTYAESASATVITASLAEAAGIVADPAAPAENYRAGERNLAARPAKIETLRFGKYALPQVSVLILPAEAEDLGCQLGSRALGGYKLQIEPRQMSATLEPPATR